MEQTTFFNAKLKFQIQARKTVTQYQVFWTTERKWSMKKFRVGVYKFELGKWVLQADWIETNCLPTINNARNFLSPHL